MGGGLIQLVAYGSQDIYLTGNPQITFFKLVYRRHTNFSMESIKQTIDGSNSITSSGGGRGSVTIDRNGDLLSKIYVVTKGANIENGSDIIQEVKLEIGGQTIDTHSINWIKNWWELTVSQDKHNSLNRMIGHRNLGNNVFIHANREEYKTIITSQIPLDFWFCRNPGLALPLIALQYHEIVLHFTWGNGSDIFKYPSTGQTATCALWCDYIYLDTDERRRFAQTSHEYLIEQVQEMSVTSGATSSVNGSQLKIDLNLNHPVKELIWDYNGILFSDITLELNGHERFAKQEEEYFTIRQPYEHHTHVPHNNLLLEEASLIPAIEDSILIEFNSSSRGIINQIGNPSSPGVPVFQLRDTHSINDDDGLFTNIGTQGTNPVGNGHFILVISNTIPLTRAIMVNTTLIFTDDSTSVTLADGTTSGDTTTFSGPDLMEFTVLEQIEHGDALKERLLNGDDLLFFECVKRNNSDLTGTHIITDGKIYRLSFGDTDVAHNNPLFRERYTDPTNPGKRIGVYSFALKPEEHQPSGTCNFSRIDTAQLVGNYNPLDTTSGDTINIYAVNYNVLRIMSGMGGLAYSN